MQFIHTLSGFVLFAFVVAYVAGLNRPQMIERLTRGLWSRKKIAGVGVAGIVLLSSLYSVTDPVSSNQTQLSQQALPSDSLKEKGQTTKTVFKERHIPFTTVEREDASLDKGEKRVFQAGIAGKKVETYNVLYIDGVEKSRDIVKEEVVQNPVEEIVLIGTYVASVQQITPAPATPQPNSSNSGGSSDSGSSEAYYENCAAARAAGVAPIYAGQPGYRGALDRDKDGIACE